MLLILIEPNRCCGSIFLLLIQTRLFAVLSGRNLVDSASSHTLVSKIKPCTFKYKSLTLKLRMAHYISYSLFDNPLLLGYL